MSRGAGSRQWTFDEALAVICDMNQKLSRVAITFLSGAGRPEVERFAACWRQMSVERRRELITAMAEMAEADFQLDYNAIFRWALRSEDSLVRERAVEGLWEDDEPSLIEPLVRLMLEDPAPTVRSRAAMSLGRFALLAELGDISESHGARVRDGLLRVVDNRDEEPEVRRRAIESVAYLSSAPVHRIIDDAYADADERMRLSAVYAMGRTADEHWAEPVLHELKADSPAMRYEAARAAGEIALRPAVGDLIALLNDSDGEVRQMAIWALGQVGGPQARRALEACQASPDEAIRDAADEALGELDFASAPLDMFYYESDGRDTD
ncbi:MAG: HEAT repeat domain-containing protein [Anaerolineae bacterium]